MEEGDGGREWGREGKAIINNLQHTGRVLELN